MTSGVYLWRLGFKIVSKIPTRELYIQIVTDFLTIPQESPRGSEEKSARRRGESIRIEARDASGGYSIDSFHVFHVNNFFNWPFNSSLAKISALNRCYSKTRFGSFYCRPLEKIRWKRSVCRKNSICSSVLSVAKLTQLLLLDHSSRREADWARGRDGWVGFRVAGHNRETGWQLRKRNWKLFIVVPISPRFHRVASLSRQKR